MANDVHNLNIDEHVRRLIANAQARRPRQGPERSEAAKRSWAAGLTARPGGISKASSALSSTEYHPPRNQDTFDTLAAKHPREPAPEALHEVITTARATAQRTIAEHPERITRPTNTAHRTVIRQTLINANWHSGAGPSGLRYSHLKDMLQDPAHGTDLLLLLANEFPLVHESLGKLPEYFQALLTQGCLDALGEKRRPIAVKETLTRLFHSTHVAHHKPDYQEAFERVGQLGVATKNGTEKVAKSAQLLHEMGNWVITSDIVNAHNAITTAATLTGTALVDPHGLDHNIAALGKDRTLIYLSGDGNQLLHTNRGSGGQGDPEASKNFCCGLFPLQQKWTNEARQAGIPAPRAYQDDFIHTWRGNLTTFEPTLDTFTADLATVGLTRHPDKQRYLPPPGHHVTMEERAFVDRTGGTIIEDGGLIIVGLPIGHDDFVRGHLSHLMEDGPDRHESLNLAEQVALMQESQPALLLLTKALGPKHQHLLRAVAPALTTDTIASPGDALSLAVGEAILQLPGTDPIGDTIASAPTDRQTHLRLAPHQHQQMFLPQSQGGWGCLSLSSTALPAYLGAAADTFQSVVAPGAIWTEAELREIAPALRQGGSVQHIITTIQSAAEDGILSRQDLELNLPLPWVNLALTTAADRQRHETDFDTSLAQGHWAPQQQTQRALQRCLAPQRLDNFRATLDTLQDDAAAAETGIESRRQAKSRHLSQCGPGAMGFIATSPGQVSMPAQDMVGALRRSLGINCLYSPGEPDALMCPRCATRADSSHAIQCPNQGTLYHTGMLSSVEDMFKQNYVSRVGHESSELFNPPHNMARTYRMDATLPRRALSGARDPTYAHTAHMLDLTLSNNICRTALNVLHTDTRPGAATAHSETRKERHYAGTYDRERVRLTTFAIETHGRLGTQAQTLLHALAEHVASRTGRTGSSTTKGHVLTRLRRFISCNHQMWLSERERAFLGRLNRGGGPALPLQEGE